jgi:glycosyltransferase involved in cell wall biosynthesis
MFSVIIPNYNKANYISATVSSVLEQTFGDYEIIVVDDGSVDNSLEVLAPFLSDSRFRIIQQTNQGVSAARNNGIRNARFDYIAFLDADDLWHPEFLKQINNAFQLYKDAAIVGTKFRRVKPGVPIDFEPMSNIRIEPVHNYFGQANTDPLFCSSASVIQRKVFDQIPAFNTRLAAGEDLDMWFRTMLHFDGVYISNILAYYTEAEQVHNNAFNLPLLEKHLARHMLDLYAPYLDQAEKKKGFHKFTYRFIQTYLLMYYFQEESKNAVKELLKRIPLKYRFMQLKYMFYFLPYPIGKKIFWSIIKRR